MAKIITLDNACDIWYKFRNPYYRDSLGYYDINCFVKGSDPDRMTVFKEFSDFIDCLKSYGWAVI